jgi:predicted TIM-barrel fold metal-dependent hydrolase
VIDSAESTLGVAPLDTASLLDFYASLTTDVRMFIGVDPYRESTLRTALALRRHPAFAGIALIPYLAGVPLSEPVFEPALRAADKHGLAVWAHCSAHFRPDVAYNIEHPAHADTILRRHPELRLLIGHAGWPWVDQACAIAARFSNVAIEFSTFPPRLILDPGWSLSPLLARSRDLAGRIFFGSGAVSAVHPFTSRISQLSELPLGEQHDSWLGAGYASWLSSS